MEIKDTSDIVKSASHLDPHLKIDGKGKILTKLYDKRDDFSFCIVNFPFICGHIPSAPAYGVFISQRYTRACHNYADILYRARLLTIRVLEPGYIGTRLKSSLQKFYGCHHELLDRYGVSICTTRIDLFNVSQFPFLFRLPWTWLFMNNSVGVSRKTKDAYPPGDLVHGPRFYWSPSCSFTFVASFVLFWFFLLYVCLRFRGLFCLFVCLLVCLCFCFCLLFYDYYFFIFVLIL